jgi:hypothetical protein
MLGAIFERFVQESPVSVMVRGLMESVFRVEQLEAIYQAHAKIQYTRKLLFSSVVDVMGLVVCGMHPSVNAAYRAKAKAKAIEVSPTAFYDKLNGIELGVTQALVRTTARELAAIIRQLGGEQPSPLAGYVLRILDGNCIAGTEHRLAVTRQTTAAVLPGKSLLVFAPQLGLAMDIFPCEDGHAQERSLFNAVLSTVAAGEVWIADRNMCTLGFLFGLVWRNANFIIREHQGMPWTAVSELVACGTVESGELFEQTVQLNYENQTLHLRRVLLKLVNPTRNQESEIALFTGLPLAVANAALTTQLYRERRSVETLFQTITVDFRCEIETLGYPKAALFAFAMAVVAYNILATVRAALGSVHGVGKIEAGLSDFYLVDEIQATYRGMMIAIPPEDWQVFEAFSFPQLASVLQYLAQQVHLASFLKHPRGEKKKKPPPQHDPKHPHLATSRLLSGQKISP